MKTENSIDKPTLFIGALIGVALTVFAIELFRDRPTSNVCAVRVKTPVEDKCYSVDEIESLMPDDCPYGTICYGIFVDARCREIPSDD